MKRLEQYTPEQIARLDQIQAILSEFNRRVAQNPSEILKMPLLNPNDIAENSHYRQLLMQKEANEKPMTL